MNRDRINSIVASIRASRLWTIKGSRLTALALIALALVWIGSGYLFPHQHPKEPSVVEAKNATQKEFKVAVMTAQRADHSRRLALSGRTEADRKVMVVARTGGALTQLNVRRGSVVKQGDVMAVLSDDAREAQVAQAKALVDQRRTELEAKRRLIETGSLPRLEGVNLEAQLKAAEAALASAQAERERGVVRAPWDGVVTEVPAEVGGAAFSMAGKEIAQLVALNPMLAVVEVSERKLAGVKVGATGKVRLVNGQSATGRVRHVSKSASNTTRTYRVEVELPNADGAIPDGITAEVAIQLAPEPATRIPRSALTFSSNGELGVRTVNGEGKVEFVPVSVSEDEQATMWVAGIPDGAKLIVQGQDFVREGQTVQTTEAASPPKTAQN